MNTGIELIAIERKEQIEKHGWDNDSEWESGELAQAAIYCLTLKRKDYPKNWGDWFYKRIQLKKNRMGWNVFKIEMRKIAGALLAAEIDRLQALND